MLPQLPVLSLHATPGYRRKRSTDMNKKKCMKKRENKDTAQFHVPHPLVQRGKSQSRFCPAIPDRRVASGTWVTNEQRTCGTRGTCQRGVQEHSVSVSRTFEKLILGLGCLFEAHRPSEKTKNHQNRNCQANLHQLLLLKAQLFRTQLFPEKDDSQIE